jgi:hypothetical protein
MTFVCVEWRRQIILLRFFFFTHFGSAGSAKAGSALPCRSPVRGIILFVSYCYSPVLVCPPHLKGFRRRYRAYRPFGGCQSD